jgi:hypothetical protein
MNRVYVNSLSLQCSVSVSTYMSPIADDDVNDAGEVYPSLHELLQMDQDDDEFKINKDSEPNASPERQTPVERISAPTGPTLNSSVMSPQFKEPPPRALDGITVHGVTAHPERRKHRAGRHAKARRLRAQLRLGTEFIDYSSQNGRLPTPTPSAYRRF